MFFVLDFPALLSVLCAAALCAMLGSVLVLRKNAVVIDAVSHAVFPGIVIAYIVSGSLAGYMMFVGGVLAAFFTYLIVIILPLNIHPTTRIGISYSFSFAVGVMLLSLFDLGGAHIDLHLIYGSIEGIVWPQLHGFSSLLSLSTWLNMPQEMKSLIVILLLTIIALYSLFFFIWMESFDHGFCRLTGMKAHVVNIVFIVLVALSSVAIFRVIGLIASLALYVCPGVIASMYSRSIQHHMRITIIMSLCFAVIGYTLCVLIPEIFGNLIEINASGAIAIVAGVSVLVNCYINRERLLSNICK